MQDKGTLTMNLIQGPKIIFLHVADNSSKLQRLCTIIQGHFYKQENVLVMVPSDEAATYIDQLLWRMPEESFLPHSIAKSPLKERVVITTSSQNINQAQVLINLCPHIPENGAAFDRIYELLDFTHPAKEELSRKRLAAYKTTGWSIEEI